MSQSLCGANDLVRAEGEDFSALAWEVSAQARYERADGAGIRASQVLLGGERVAGHGLTSTEARRELARELDRWSERVSR